MGAVDVPAGGGGGRHKKKHKGKKRMGVRIDMTPMVDVAFLLLTFFILTTTFSKPQAMEINLPPDTKQQVQVAESKLCTIRVNESEDVFRNMGMDQPEKTTVKDLRSYLAEKAREIDKFTVLLKVDRKAKYHTTVDILDQLQRARVTRFSLAALDDQDKQLLTKAIGN